jgi:hypothetical protein
LCLWWLRIPRSGSGSGSGSLPVRLVCEHSPPSEHFRKFPFYPVVEPPVIQSKSRRPKGM